MCIVARKTTFFDGWDARSCLRITKNHLFTKQLQKSRIFITALSETAIYDVVTSTVGEYTIIHSGISTEAAEFSSLAELLGIHGKMRIRVKNSYLVATPFRDTTYHSLFLSS